MDIEVNEPSEGENSLVFDHKLEGEMVEESTESDNKIESKIVFNDFEAGAIHKKEFRDFWVNTLKSDVWVLSTLDKGYMIPFSSQPSKYEERNNKTARENMGEVRKIVADMWSKKNRHASVRWDW